MLNIESWGKDCARKKSGQHASMTAVFAIPEMLWICFWDAPNFYEMLWIFLRCFEFFLRCSELFVEMLWFLFEMLWMATMTLSSKLLHLRHCHHQSMQALKLWGRKNCALLAVTPLRCITSDQFIRSTEIKWRFCPFHCMHFDTLGHSDTSMYLIYEVSLKMAIWLTLNWLFQVSYDIEMEHIFKSEFSCPIFITVFLVENAVNAAARLRWS